MKELQSYFNWTDNFKDADLQELQSYTEFTDDVGDGNVIIVAPTPGQVEFPVDGTYNWEQFLDFTRYRVRTSTDSSFTAIVEEKDVNATQLQAALQATTNYWTKVIPLLNVSGSGSDAEGEITGTSISPSSTSVVEGESDNWFGSVAGSGTYNQVGTWTRQSGDAISFTTTGNQLTLSPSAATSGQSAVFRFTAENGMFSEITISVVEEQVAGSYPDTLVGDRTALSDFRAATNGDSWDTVWSQATIDSGDLSTLWGVNTNADGRVIHIDLQGGSKTPPEEFTYPENPGNNAVGTLNDSLGNLKKIQYFNVKQNHLTGQIPTSIKTEWTECKRLLLTGHTREPRKNLFNHPRGGGGVPGKNIYATNAFTGDFFASNWSAMQALEVLECMQNTEQGGGITGSLSSTLFDLPVLNILMIEREKISGTIPTNIGNSPIYFVTLQVNLLTGSLPASFGDCPNLKWLSISYNNLSGDIPIEMGNKVWNLFTLDHQGANFPQSEDEGGFTGGFPTQLFPSSESGYEFFDSIRLESNSFSGPLPDDGVLDTSILQNMSVLSLSLNDFTGAIKNWVTELPCIQLNLQFNIFENDLPAGFHNSGSRMYARARNIRLNNNSGLTGPLFDANPGPSILVIACKSCNFSGKIPAIWGRSTSSRNLKIDVSNNPLINSYEIVDGHGFIRPPEYVDGVYQFTTQSETYEIMGVEYTRDVEVGSGIRNFEEIDVSDCGLSTVDIDNILLDMATWIDEVVGTPSEGNHPEFLNISGNAPRSSNATIDAAVATITGAGVDLRE